MNEQVADATPEQDFLLFIVGLLGMSWDERGSHVQGTQGRTGGLGVFRTCPASLITKNNKIFK